MNAHLNIIISSLYESTMTAISLPNEGQNCQKQASIHMLGLAIAIRYFSPVRLILIKQWIEFYEV